METLDIYPCGTDVTIKMNNVKGLVTAILIRPDSCISYEISYWRNNEYTTSHLYEFEFCSEHPEKSKIGFKS